MKINDTEVRHLLAALLLGLSLGGCQLADGAGARTEEGAETDREAQPRPTVVDSIRPLEEEVARFRAALPEHPERLSGGEASLEALVDALVAGVNRGDQPALAALAVTRSEFAYFHYPYTHYTRPPYELAPALVWYRLGNRSGKGMARLLATFEHTPLEVGSLSCEDPKPAGAARLHDCSVTVRDADGDWVQVQLFGSVLERDGRYKLLSFANDL
jgi:hypothetical protein